MVVDVLRRILGLGRSGSVEDYAAQWGGVDYLQGVPGAEAGAPAGAAVTVDYDAIVASLEYHKREVDSLRDMLVSEIDDAYRRMVEAARQGDRDVLEALAVEAALKEKLVRALTMLSKLIQIAIGRVRTAKSTEEAVKAIQPVVMMMRTVNESFASLAPELAVQLDAIREEAEKIYAFQGFSVPVQVRSIADVMPDAKELIRKAMIEANKDAEKILPKPPAEVAKAAKPQVDVDEVASRLLEYIKANGGRLRVSEAARALGVSPEIVRLALRRLEEKGVIRLQRATRQTPKGSQAGEASWT